MFMKAISRPAHTFFSDILNVINNWGYFIEVTDVHSDDTYSGGAYPDADVSDYRERLLAQGFLVNTENPLSFRSHGQIVTLHPINYIDTAGVSKEQAEFFLICDQAEYERLQKPVLFSAQRYNEVIQMLDDNGFEGERNLYNAHNGQVVYVNSSTPAIKRTGALFFDT